MKGIQLSNVLKYDQNQIYVQILCTELLYSIQQILDYEIEWKNKRSHAFLTNFPHISIPTDL